MYAEGQSLNAIAHSLNVPYSKVRKVLEDADVAIRPRTSYYCSGSAHPTAKLTPEQRDTLIAELRRGDKRYQQLSIEYGITRERVRQIAKAANAPCGRDIQRRLAQERDTAHTCLLKEREEARQLRRDERYQRWQELWSQGLSLQDMAEQLGMSWRSIGVRITELRRVQPGWFPYRRVKLTPEVLQQRAAAKSAKRAQKTASRQARLAEKRERKAAAAPSPALPDAPQP